MIRSHSGVVFGRGIVLKSVGRRALATAFLGAVGAGVVAIGVVIAADLPPQQLPPSAPAAYIPAVPDWTVSVGIEARVLPQWPGASDHKFGVSVLPLFNIRNQGTPPIFFGPRDSFGFGILNFSQLRIGPAILFVGDRPAQNYKELYGLGSVNYTAQVGIFADFWALPWLRLRGEVRQGIGGETGVTGDIFLDAIVPVGQWVLSAGPRVTLQTTAAVSPYFTITQAQAAGTVAAAPTSGLVPLLPYNASGGLYSYGAGTKVQYAFSQQWSAHGFVEYQRLTGSVADSPIVTVRGSPNQFIYGVGATYSFNTHPWW